MESSDTDFTATSGNILSSQHGSVGGRLVTIGLDLHAAGDARDRLLARQIGDMDEGVVEGCVDVGDTEDKLALSDLGTERDGLFLRGLDLLGGLHPNSRQSIHPNCMLCAVHYHSCCVLAA